MNRIVVATDVEGKLSAVYLNGILLKESEAPLTETGIEEIALNLGLNYEEMKDVPSELITWLGDRYPKELWKLVEFIDNL